MANRMLVFFVRFIAAGILHDGQKSFVLFERLIDSPLS